jgi:hypothetical protein
VLPDCVTLAALSPGPDDFWGTYKTFPHLILALTWCFWIVETEVAAVTNMTRVVRASARALVLNQHLAGGISCSRQVQLRGGVRAQGKAGLEPEPALCRCGSNTGP